MRNARILLGCGRCSPFSSARSTPGQTLLPLRAKPPTAPAVAATASFATHAVAGLRGSSPRHRRSIRRLRLPASSSFLSSSSLSPIRERFNDGNHEAKAHSFAFAFDIDGVLLHMARPIPGATEALQYLQAHEIPFILLTNGGGKHEAERVADLSARLGIQLSVDNFVQSHTPFRMLVQGPEESGFTGHDLFEHAQYPQSKLEDSGARPLGLGLQRLGLTSRQSVLDNEKLSSYAANKLRGKTVLVTGSDAAKAREIAESYGFGPVVIPADILKAYPDVYPFDPLMKELYEATARPLPPDLKVDAILVFNDPRDWALDTQIIIDLLLSQKGRLGTYSNQNGQPTQPNRGWQQDGTPRLYFSNPDLFWSARYHLPRLGQGSFQAALAGVWAQITQTRFRQHPGRPEVIPRSSFLRRTVIGKPTRVTYGYAEWVLENYRAKVLGSGGGQAPGLATPLRTVYMVGDNPESDIRGANNYKGRNGTAWSSILVRTGVWDEKRDGAPAHEPKAIVNAVGDAVDWALAQQMGL